jgi:hypothetical protein
MKGKRTAEDAKELFKDIERRRSIASPIPVFKSDNWSSFEEGLVYVYSIQETPPYNGIGKRTIPVLISYSTLKYARICKRREKGQVVEIVER